MDRECGYGHEHDLEQFQSHDHAALREPVSHLAGVGKEENVRQYEESVAV
jgi:hypothetical protein